MNKFNDFFIIPRKKSPWFVVAWGLFSTLPIIGVFVYGGSFLFFGMFFSMIYFPLNILDDDMGEGERWLWALAFFFTGSTTLPVYWLFRILIPFLEERRTMRSTRIGRVSTLILSLFPMFSIPLTSLVIYLFDLSSQVWWAPLITSLPIVFFFSYHALRYPTKALRQEIFWVISFFLTGTLSLPAYWFSHMYKPTLFPTNVVLESHPLWDSVADSIPAGSSLTIQTQDTGAQVQEIADTSIDEFYLEFLEKEERLIFSGQDHVEKNE